ncbi:hypothetical protein BCR36DRAFT_371191 [Piromyces finnis]|uniref:Uncharacterized protein n=1 Tax=Piromyces finnis TaxID=1754191 RepID=A0A1Y1V7X3_9FUNG|nr:hypothetical protein BCR36DRAFT_371191 [Piromyces finnis]|eukprot:ORX48701.1 hypothetical protein BCR36DRAFT_371191 [Piromyces finnis]
MYGLSWIQCKIEYEKLYVIIEDEESGFEFWRYPKFVKKNFISSLNNKKLFIGESLYDERFIKYINLTEYGFNITENGRFYDRKHVYTVAEEKDANHLQYIYLEKKEGYFRRNFYKDNGNNDRSIDVENISNAQYVQFKCEENYGYYIEDEFDSIVKKSNITVYDGKKLYVGDSIISKDNICRDKTKFSITPLVVNGFNIFENFSKKIGEYGKLPSSMSLRCDQKSSNTFFAIYNDDDTNEMIDKVMNKCRRDDKLISNTDYNKNFCLNNSLIGANDMSCLT